ncbi:MAG: hypothetical protein OXP12_00010 [Thaumarchaeota archaeon]|nr:hypothetical protein [Nitrososphaerota archaeon]
MSNPYCNWYRLRNILEKEFGIITRWTFGRFMEFSGPNGTTMVSKDNNMLRDSVEGVLEKLGIDKEEFACSCKKV